MSLASDTALLAEIDTSISAIVTGKLSTKTNGEGQVLQYLSLEQLQKQRDVVQSRVDSATNGAGGCRRVRM